MKLGRKIFFAALFLTLFAVQLTAFLIHALHFESELAGAKESAAALHESLIADLQDGAAYEELRQNTVILSDGDRRALAERIFSSLPVGLSGAALSFEGQTVASASGLNPEKASEEIFLGGAIRRSIREDEGKYTLRCLSGMTFSGKPVQLETFTDLTPLYESFRTGLNTVRIAGILLSILVAGVLLGLTRRNLAPLDKINQGLRQIAGGDWEHRLRAEGAGELRALSENVNAVAEASRQNLEELQRLAEGRKNFIDGFAHEMKTPLTSVMGFGDILRIKKEVSDEERVRYASVIVEEATRLKKLSGKLLELAVSGQSQPEWQELDAKGILETVALEMSPVLEKDGIRLVTDCEEIRFFADRELICSLLMNLVDNARKASGEGDTVELVCRLKGEMILLAVVDHGIGMEKDQLNKVTEPFYMVDKARSRRKGGTGLGLSLCRQIAEIHGGSMQIESSPGEGTAVFVLLPQRRSE